MSLVKTIPPEGIQHDHKTPLRHKRFDPDAELKKMEKEWDKGFDMTRIDRKDEQFGDWKD